MLNGRKDVPSPALQAYHANSSSSWPDDCKALLNAAKKLTGGKPINGLHLLRAALKPDGPLAGMQALKDFLDQGQWEILGDLIVARWRDKDEAALAQAFETYQDKVTSQAAAKRVRLNVAFVIWSLLEDASTSLLARPERLAGLLDACDINVDDFKVALEQEFESTPVELRVLNSDEVRKEAERQLKKLEPSSDRRGVGLAKADFPCSVGALTTLNDNRLRAHPRFTLFCGPRGSSPAHLPDVIVDSLSDEAFQIDYPHLKDCQGIYSLDLQALGILKTISPRRVLEYALEKAEKSLLMIDRIEALAQPGEVWQELREVLNRPASGLCFGRFIHDFGEGEKSNQEVQVKVAAMGLVNLNIHIISPLDEAQTKHFLEKVYVPEWSKKGCIFEEAAFQHIFALQAGARSRQRPISNPHLAVLIGAAAVRAARSSPDQLRLLAGQALKKLQDLRTTRSPRLQPYEQVIEEASREINQVHQNGSLKKENGKYVLTRAHVTLQLFIVQFAFDPPPLPRTRNRP